MYYAPLEVRVLIKNQTGDGLKSVPRKRGGRVNEKVTKWIICSCGYAGGGLNGLCG
jgi:hypothetical protein